VAAGASLALLGALTWPLLFSDSTFNEDWLNHLWYMWHQSQAIRANHLPSLFYGGTIYALTGTLSLVLGSVLDAYVLTYLLGFAAAYAGWYWISRMFGLERWLAHAPGVVFVTSASYLMTLYGLGDWPEFLAVSVMPLMIASGLSVMRADRMRPRAAAVLAASCVVFFGTHLLTVIWGSTVLLIAGAAILACVPDARRAIGWSQLARIAALLIPALLVNAWFLLPTVAYESKTVIAESYPIFRRLVQLSMYTVADRRLFTLSRARVGASVVTTALPVLPMLWVIAGVALSYRARRGDGWRRVLLVLCATATLLLMAMTHAALILALPRIYATLQFSFRLESYVLLAVAGAMLAALRANRDGARAVRIWTWMLLPVLAVCVVGAAQQTAAYPSSESRSLAFSSYLKPTYEQEGLLNYVHDRASVSKEHLPLVVFPPLSVRGDHVSVITHAKPGERVDTNLRSGPEFVDVSGARIVGADLEANDVLEIEGPTLPSRRPAADRGRLSAPAERISVGPADGFPVVAGRVLTGLGVVILAFELLALVVRDGALGRRLPRGLQRWTGRPGC